jgi:hypothetical protein
MNVFVLYEDDDGFTTHSVHYEREEAIKEACAHICRHMADWGPDMKNDSELKKRMVDALRQRDWDSALSLWNQLEGPPYFQITEVEIKVSGEEPDLEGI